MSSSVSVSVFAISPLIAHLFVQPFGERFRQPVRQRLGHDGIVIVVILLELRAQRLHPDAGRDRKRADIIRSAETLSAR